MLIVDFKDNSSRKRIGEIIRDTREENGITQETLSKKAGISISQIRKIEHGEISNFESLLDIVRVLNIEIVLLINKLHSNTNTKLIDYIIACVDLFAHRHQLTIQQSYNYLERFKGMSFLINHYETEHLLSFDDVIDDLTKICHKNGGELL